MNNRYLFRGKHKDNGERVYGNLIQRKIWSSELYVIRVEDNGFDSYVEYEVIPETVCQCTGMKDRNGKTIFEGDIVKYITWDNFLCTSIVKFGEYRQDGSDGEYGAATCLGFYVDLIKTVKIDLDEYENRNTITEYKTLKLDDDFTTYDDFNPEWFGDYRNQVSILSIILGCEVIGNIHDDSELLEVGK